MRMKTMFGRDFESAARLAVVKRVEANSRTIAVK
jgi:hypothetical protein